MSFGRNISLEVLSDIQLRRVWDATSFINYIIEEKGDKTDIHHIILPYIHISHLYYAEYLPTIKVPITQQQVPQQLSLIINFLD